MTTIRDSIEILLKGDAKECIEWANKREALLREYPPEESLKRAQWVVDNWVKVKASREKWLGVDISSLEKDSITVGDLYTYLTSILEIRPDVASIPVYHEECCGATETGFIEFDVDKGVLVLY
jgi:hypothetical protein